MRQVIIHPGKNSYRVAGCPSLPGCVSQGTTRETAVTNIKEAIDGHSDVLKADGLPVPEEKFDALIVAV